MTCCRLSRKQPGTPWQTSLGSRVPPHRAGVHGTGKLALSGCSGAHGWHSSGSCHPTAAHQDSQPKSCWSCFSLQLCSSLAEGESEDKGIKTGWARVCECCRALHCTTQGTVCGLRRGWCPQENKIASEEVNGSSHTFSIMLKLQLAQASIAVQGRSCSLPAILCYLLCFCL